MYERIIDLITGNTVFGISVLNLLLALGVAAITFTVSRAAIGFMQRRVSAVGSVGQVLVKVLAGTSNLLLLLASLLVGLGMLDLPERWLTRVSSLWFVVAALQIGLWLNRAIALGLVHYFSRHGGQGLYQGSALATLSAWGTRTVVVGSRAGDVVQPGREHYRLRCQLGGGRHRCSTGSTEYSRRSFRFAVNRRR